MSSIFSSSPNDRRLVNVISYILNKNTKRISIATTAIAFLLSCCSSLLRAAPSSGGSSCSNSFTERGSLGVSLHAPLGRWYLVYRTSLLPSSSESVEWVCVVVGVDDCQNDSIVG